MSHFSSITLQPIGIIHTPYNEKFSVPRQPDLVKEGKGICQLLPPYNSPDAVRGLEQFSHLWLIFQFHHIPTRHWHSTVRPPRLGGNQRIGVFASRSTHRPNPIGLSKVKLDNIQITKGEVKLQLGSVDLVNGTPILDIKPYLTYADSEPLACSSFAQQKPHHLLLVKFTDNVEKWLLQAVRFQQNFANFGITNPRQFILEIIAQDPRPAYQQGKMSDKIYGMTLAGYNIRWQIDSEQTHLAWVIDIQKLN